MIQSSGPQARNVMANWPHPGNLVYLTPGSCHRFESKSLSSAADGAFIHFWSKPYIIHASKHLAGTKSISRPLPWWLCGTSSQSAHATGSVQPADSLVEDKSVGVSHAGGLKMHLSQPMMLCAKVCGSDSLGSTEGFHLSKMSKHLIPSTV